MGSKYQNGKIYKIVDVGYNKCYIGSTCEALSQRMARHRGKYTAYLKSGADHTRSFSLFDEFGVENCKIEMIELYPCISKEELRKREGFYIQNTDCVNKQVAGRTRKQYYEDNKEHCLQQQSEYRKNNQDKVASRLKAYAEAHKKELKLYKEQYRHNNEEKIQEQMATYYNNNKERLKQASRERGKQTFVCGCGTIRRIGGKKKHEQTKKHQEWLKQQEPEEEAEPVEQSN